MTRTLRPRLAASLVVADTSGDQLTLLMGRRSEAHAFMPGFHVFPGGAYERGDRFGPELLSKSDANRIARGLPAGQRHGAKANAIAWTAVRELEEETGFQLVSHAPGLLRPLARAITPPGQVRRYDTRFFLASSEHFTHSDQAPDNELLDVDWIRVPVSSDIKIHRITDIMISQVIDALGRDVTGPIPCFRMRHGRHVVEYH